MKEQKVFEIIEIPKEIKDKFPTLGNVKRICLTNVYCEWAKEAIVGGEVWKYISYRELYFLFKLRNYICKGALEKYHKFSFAEYWCRNHTDENFKRNTGEFRGLLAKVHFGCDAVSDKISYGYRTEFGYWKRSVIFVQHEIEE